MRSYIMQRYPQLREVYEEIINNDRDDYIDELRKKWENSKRVKFVFD